VIQTDLRLFLYHSCTVGKKSPWCGNCSKPNMLDDPSLTTIITNIVAIAGGISATVYTGYKLWEHYQERLDVVRARLVGKW